MVLPCAGLVNPALVSTVGEMPEPFSGGGASNPLSGSTYEARNSSRTLNLSLLWAAPDAHEDGHTGDSDSTSSALVPACSCNKLDVIDQSFNCSCI